MESNSKATMARNIATLCVCIFWLLGCAGINYQDSAYPSTPEIMENYSEQALLYRLILVGDLGTIDEEYHQAGTLGLVKQLSKKNADKTTVVFLGDNIYDTGLSKENWKTDIKILKRQYQVLGNNSKDGPAGIFVLGNHDWDNAGQKGQSKAITQFDHLVNLKSNLSEPIVLPKGGCPGPENIDLPKSGGDGSKLFRIIAIDSQWWLHQKKTKNNCFASSQDDIDQYEEYFLKEFEHLLATAGEREVVIVAHHPLDTHGPHGGYSSSVPVIGAFINWVRKIVPESLARFFGFDKNQDLSGKGNEYMLSKFKEVLARHKPLVYASGHEHTLQVIGGGRYVSLVLVSGSGARSSPVTAARDEESIAAGTQTIFAYGGAGLMTLDYLEGGESGRELALRVYARDRREFEADYKIVYSRWIK